MSDVAWHDDDVDTQRVQPYQALKDYVCPGCLGVIPRGHGHLVVDPEARARPSPPLALRLLGVPAPPTLTRRDV